jgi:predicted TIM-barrel fold metal-dependent hydrolase
VPATAAYRRALRLLGDELGCDPDEEAVLEARAGLDASAYANQLLKRGGAGQLLLDHGFAVPDAFTPAEHRKAVHLPQRDIVRLEAVAESLVGPSDEAAGWLDAVRGRLRTEVKAGAVAVKAITAYRASLRLTRPEMRDVAAAYGRLRVRAREGEAVRVAGDALCHALLWAAAEECRALGVPLQLHTGFGDPDEDLAEASPLGLRPLLREERLRGLRVVLLHAYPYHREAAYLCSVYPDVYMDLSLAIPLAAADGARALGEALGLCPWTKLLYASDASRLPELYFVAGVLHRQALADALGSLVSDGTLTIPQADEAGRLVLAGNARRIYRLD